MKAEQDTTVRRELLAFLSPPTDAAGISAHLDCFCAFFPESQRHELESAFETLLPDDRAWDDSLDHEACLVISRGLLFMEKLAENGTLVDRPRHLSPTAINVF